MKLYGLSQRMCEWDDLGMWRTQIRAALERGETGLVSPFLLLALSGITAAEQRTCSELWMQARMAGQADEREALDFQFQSEVRPKIRIGYLSCDFHDHATSLLLIELFEAHDRERFEVFAYSYGADDGKAMRPRLKKAFEHFIDIQALSTGEAASAIHADGIDILIDLKGYTRNTRTAILGLHPAPLQVNYLGYPGTLGNNLCDYIITDRFLTPPDTASSYSEAFAYLPDSYQPHSRHSEIGLLPQREDVGLPEEGFVFCCFNQAYKINPEIFDVWCQLLSRCPDSVLWLLKDDMAEGNLRNAAFQRGISPHRLIFAAHTTQLEHLSRLQCADLVLDTLPYNAHTTASDALWAGVPLVTCVGDTFASRVAGSLLHAVGLPELATDSLDSYFNLALALASDPAQLAEVRQRLAHNRLTTPLFDILSYTRHLEGLYEAMWSRHLAGDAPGTLGAH